MDQAVKKISHPLIEEIEKALALIKSYGSMELYVQDGVVTQVTVRNIKKTKLEIPKENRKADKK